MSLRLRIIPKRHLYGHFVYAYEVYDPARPEGHQIITMCGWLPSWDAARIRGLAALRDRARREGP